MLESPVNSATTGYSKKNQKNNKFVKKIVTVNCSIRSSVFTVNR